MASSYRFAVSGRVQGVFFRQSAMNEARRLGLSGWVRNREDGAVEGMTQGELDALEKFRTWLNHGPPAATVASVAWDAAEAGSEPRPEAGFSIRR